MKVLVTGVNGQLGHDVMNELAKRGHEGVGSDLAPAYAGVRDDTPVTDKEGGEVQYTRMPPGRGCPLCRLDCRGSGRG